MVEKAGSVSPVTVIGRSCIFSVGLWCCGQMAVRIRMTVESSPAETMREKEAQLSALNFAGGGEEEEEAEEKE
jgi:hypothetical protein